MGLTIIIPTVPGNEEILARCMGHIIGCSKNHEYKVVIVKNNFRGFAIAVNEALSKVGDDDVVLLNDDAFPISEKWIDMYYEKSKEADIIGCETSLRDEHVVFAAVFIKNTVIKKIGVLDEGFVFGDWEDVDYCIRALDAGFKLAEVKEHIMAHPEPSSTWRRFNDDFNNKRVRDTKEYFLNKWKGTRWEKRQDGSEW
jgi:glycosyltransferase involved in cell wall biosynthesis